MHNNNKRNVANIVNFLINHGGVTSTNTMCWVSLLSAMLSHCFTLHLVSWVIWLRHSQSFYGEALGFPGGTVILRLNILQLTPLQRSTIESSSVVSPPMSGIVCVWKTFDGLSRVFFTLYLSWKLCAGMTRCTGRYTGQPTNLRYWEGCNVAMLQNSCISMGVCFSFS